GRLLVFRALVALAALLPLALLVSRLIGGDLGPDPGQEVTESLGLAAFQLLLVTLCMTPMRKWTGWPGWMRVRRMLGLFSFFYVILHVLAFLQFILGWQDVWATFTKRPYIVAGLVAFLLMVPLAVTSTQGMVRRLGKRWKALHKSIYAVALVAWVHFLWQARSDIGEMVVYGAVVVLLLGLRL
ncbi:unnamed protein product, partial [Ectocarpus sp. 12 AP-2014]